jgi:predicted nucleic acid-binding protein
VKYVLDASVALKWVLTEIDSDRALQLQADFHAGHTELIVPHIFPAEVAHALVRAERKGVLLVGSGPRFLGKILAHPIPIVDCNHLILASCGIAARERVSVYDCLYLLLAEQEQCSLVTADERFFRQLSGQYSSLVLLSSLS